MLNPQLNRRPVSMMRRAALAAMLLGARVADRGRIAGDQHAARQVVGSVGPAAADATLRLTALGNSEQVFETRTDANGSFQFAAVPAGEYMLVGQVPGLLRIASAHATLRRRHDDFAEGAGRHAAGNGYVVGGGNDRGTRRVEESKAAVAPPSLHAVDNRRASSRRR